ncbi:hypothetical protein BC828DRAFT_88328 [Blastocladiella britannica]|nr:hypothetical protein BC828DRAFT_88328 [Blastocladiella britannica]
MATTPTATDRTDNNSSGPLATLRTLALKPIYPLTRLGATLTTHAALRVTAIGHARAVPPPSQAAMLASSHCGMVMDPAVLIATNQDRQCHFWAKREVWAMPVMAFVFDGLGAVPVARPKMAVGSLGHSIEPTMGSIPRLAAEGGESPGSRERSVTADSTASSSNGGGGANAALWRATSEMLARGQLLCVFPEGTSYTLPHLIAFKDGLSRAALDRARRAKDARESGDTSAQSAPIIPVGVSYVEKTWWRTSVVCTYGDPINVDEYLGKDVSELTREIERRVRLVTVNAPDWYVVLLWIFFSSAHHEKKNKNE